MKEDNSKIGENLLSYDAGNKVNPTQVAAVGLALLGVALIAFFGLTISGHVVANNSTDSGGNFFGFGTGIVFLILSFMIFSRLRRNKKTNTRRKTRK